MARPSRPQDFVYSIERACSPALGSPVAPVYLGDIVGAQAYIDGEAEHIAGLEALEPLVLRMRIDAPKAYFLAKLTYSTAFVVDRRSDRGAGQRLAAHAQRQRALCAGESVGQAHRAGAQRALLWRQARRWRASSSRSPAVCPSPCTRTIRLDIVGVSPSEIERVLDPDNPLHDQTGGRPELSVQTIWRSTSTRRRSTIVAVRQAFACAIDRDKLADLVLNGTALPAQRHPAARAARLRRRLAGLAPTIRREARALLAASRYGSADKLPEIVLTISGTDGYMPGTTAAILGMIEENLGIQMTVEQVEWAYFLRDLNEQRYQMFSSGWIADYPDSQNFLDILFHSASSQNHMGYRNAQVDALLEQARVDHGRRSARRSIARRKRSS